MFDQPKSLARFPEKYSQVEIFTKRLNECETIKKLIKCTSIREEDFYEKSIGMRQVDSSVVIWSGV